MGKTKKEPLDGKKEEDGNKENSRKSESKNKSQKEDSRQKEEVKAQEKPPAAHSYAGRGELLEGESRFHFNWEQFNQLCAIQCSQEEIAAVFKVSADTISRRVKETHGVTFAEYFETKRQPGITSLRRKQFQLALSGNTAMILHLAKAYIPEQRAVDQSETDQLAAAFVHYIAEKNKLGEGDNE